MNNLLNILINLFIRWQDAGGAENLLSRQLQSLRNGRGEILSYLSPTRNNIADRCRADLGDASQLRLAPIPLLQYNQQPFAE